MTTLTKKPVRKRKPKNLAVAVAKDVLKSLRQFKFRQGTYLQSVNSISAELSSASPKSEVQGFVPELIEKCEVCLKGACILAKARVADELKLSALSIEFGEVELKKDADEILDGVFDKETLGMIEAAFEGYSGYCDDLDEGEAAAAMHAMQSGVAMEMNFDSGPTSPKHLRVGVNSALRDQASLVGLLVKKGVISMEEYAEAIVSGAEEEAKRYKEHLSRHYGANIELY